MTKLLQGKHCLITGAAGDIALATLKKMLEQGAQVSLVDMNPINPETLPKDALNRIEIIQADVTDETATKQFVEQASDRFGKIDAFFAAAGVEGPITSIAEYSLADFERVMSINVAGVFLGLKHVAPAMNDGGSIVLASSTAGLRGGRNMSAYFASKHAVLGLARCAALEYAPRRIRVNAIHPGAVEGKMIDRIASGMFGDANPQQLESWQESSVPLGRMITPDEIADAVIYLSANGSAMVTGSSLVIDGGTLGS